jgi:hypothetical protein
MSCALHWSVVAAIRRADVAPEMAYTVLDSHEPEPMHVSNGQIGGDG